MKFSKYLIIFFSILFLLSRSLMDHLCPFQICSNKTLCFFFKNFCFVLFPRDWRLSAPCWVMNRSSICKLHKKVYKYRFKPQVTFSGMHRFFLITLSSWYRKLFILHSQSPYKHYLLFISLGFVSKMPFDLQFKNYI